MEYIVEIKKLDHQGRGIAFTDGIITFIPNVLIGETVKIEITKNNKKIREAKVIDIIIKSKNRIQPLCKYYNLCGGCSMMHMSYADELNYKENKIKEIFNKYTNINLNVIKKIIPNDEYFYRNKATFQVKENIGYFKEKSYEIVPIDNCLIVDNKINEILKIVKKIKLNNIYQIVIRVSENESMVIFKANKEIELDIEELKKYVSTIILYNKDYKILYGNGYIVDKIGEYSFFISPDSFFQVNNKSTYNLYNKVLEYVNKSSYLLDLYCGTGTIGIFLNKISNKILGIEINESAVEDANKNKELNRLKNIDFICTDVSTYNEIDNFDVVIVDPPRNGLDKKTIEYLISLHVDKIVYVSCDPMTLARDLNILNEHYDILEITPVDMFSKTYHVECVCVLKLR